MLDRRWLTNSGPYVQELETRICELLGVKNCIAMCNGTLALQITIKALGLTGEVIVPSFTFVATAHALQWQGISPVFCDIDPRTHTIDPAEVEKLITSLTSGIVGVHLWGQPCQVDKLTEIASRRNLQLLFDAAHAFGCSHRGRMIGNFGRAEVFSFHATKFVNTFEGGAVVTNDDELAQKIRLMNNFGFVDYDKVACLGTNGKMSEISAAMGLSSLESMSEIIDRNYANYKCYREQLSGIAGITIFTYDEIEKCNYQYVVLEVDDNQICVTRDQLQEILWAENVIARRYFFPGCHNMEPYRSSSYNAVGQLPNTERVSRQVLCLPTGMAIGVGHIDILCQVIRLVAQYGPEIARRLPCLAPNLSKG